MLDVVGITLTIGIIATGYFGVRKIWFEPRPSESSEFTATAGPEPEAVTKLIKIVTDQSAMHRPANPVSGLRPLNADQDFLFKIIEIDAALEQIKKDRCEDAALTVLQKITADARKSQVNYDVYIGYVAIHTIGEMSALLRSMPETIVTQLLDISGDTQAHEALRKAASFALKKIRGEESTYWEQARSSRKRGSQES